METTTLGRILVVDDESELATALGETLSKHQYDAVAVHSGNEAIQILSRETFDILLCDLMLPDMDGLGVLREALRSDPRIVGLLMTGHGTIPTAVEAMKIGAFDYVLKPFKMQSLLPILNRALGVRRLRLDTVQLRETLAIYELSMAMAFTLDQNTLLDRLADAALQQCEADGVSVLLPTSSGEELWIAAVRGEDRASLLGSRVPMDRSVSGWVARHKEPVILQGKANDPRFRDFKACPPADSSASVPMLAGGKLVGVLNVNRTQGQRPFTLGQVKGLNILASAAASALENIQDIAERRKLEEQFRQAQKMEAVGRLAGGVAHDFNNLLTVINGYGELALGNLPADDPTRELIREIVAAGNRAAGLTRQLLAFSRKAILEPKVLDLKAVVADIDKMLRRIIGEDIQLAVAADPEAGFVLADPGQIEQVILNLVVNARDAMPQGGKLTIEVRDAELDDSYAQGHPDARPGRHVMLAVSDTGCGMDEATMARIFEPFFSTKGEKGTGLGLATVHGIVKQSGGHVAVSSEPGRGTTFKVYLPRVQQLLSARKSFHGQTALPAGSETVLIVEDEDGVRALTRRVLQKCGYTVLEAADGSEAVRAAGQHQERIDLLVTDVVLPRMGGREVASRLLARHSEVKVLFLSGYTDDAVVRHGILEAEVAFLQKPFTPASLAVKVREVLDSK